VMMVIWFLPETSLPLFGLIRKLSVALLGCPALIDALLIV
jgi:hypothetical protein